MENENGTENKTSFKRGASIAASMFFNGLMKVARGMLSIPGKISGLLAKVEKKIHSLSKGSKLLQGSINLISRFVRLLRAYITGKYTDIPKEKIILILAALLYFMLPADLIPDIVPFYGYIDDLSLLFWVGRSVQVEMDKFAEWERSQAETDGS